MTEKNDPKDMTPEERKNIKVEFAPVHLTALTELKKNSMH